MAAAAPSANSGSNSQSPANHPPPVKHVQSQDVSSELMESKEVKGESVDDSKEVNKESEGEPIDIMDSKEHIEKFQKYEADFKQYLMSKYFSDKTVFGGNIFDVKMNIDGQTITASRLPPYQSYLDPTTFDEMISEGSSSPAETPSASTSNGKPST